MLGFGKSDKYTAPGNYSHELHTLTLKLLIEELGLQVVGVEEVAPNLLTEPGLYASRVPTEAERADVERAAYIVEAISQVDVGQGAVVARGCAWPPKPCPAPMPCSSGWRPPAARC